MNIQALRSLFIAGALFAPSLILEAKSNDQHPLQQPLSAIDADIWSKLHHSNEVEVRLGNLALSRSLRQDVRDYAKLSITDHIEEDRLITELAAQKNLELRPFDPNSERDRLEAQREATVEKNLSEATEITFDQLFLIESFNAHEKNIKWLKAVQSGFQLPESRRLAANLIPSLKHHREMARALLSKLDSQTDSPPNVLLIKIPAKEHQMPTAETWQDNTPLEIVMVNLAVLPVDEAGNIRSEELAKSCITANQTHIALTSNETYSAQQVPAEVQQLFRGLPENPQASRFATYNRWYSYHPYRSNYGVYGYGYRPHYGYYGSQPYYPYYGVYYNGRTFNYTASGYPYWQGGNYYYPYYRRW